MIDLLPDPLSFLQMVRKAFGDREQALLYVEVPNVERTLRNGIVWNIVYEKHTWFTEESLGLMAQRAGFSPLHVSTCWHDEYLGIDLAPAKSAAAHPHFRGLAEMQTMTQTFAANVDAVTEEWRKKLAAMRHSGERVALWGAGARAVTFLAGLEDSQVVSVVVDINPARHGKYMPRTAHLVQTPSVLKGARLDTIIISNPAYATEIKEQARALGFKGRFQEL